MAASPNSLTMTNVFDSEASAGARPSSVVLPLPRNLVNDDTGVIGIDRPRRSSRAGVASVYRPFAISPERFADFVFKYLADC